MTTIADAFNIFIKRSVAELPARSLDAKKACDIIYPVARWDGEDGRCMMVATSVQKNSGEHARRKRSRDNFIRGNSRRDPARENSQCDSALKDSRKSSIHGASLKRLPDKILLKRLSKLRGAERAVLLKILRYLNEIERRRLYVPRGYASLYEFRTDYLKYSRTAAWRRIHAARCIERFPQVAGLLASGELSLTVVSMISGILNTKNADDILNNIKGKPTREAEMLVSRHRPAFMLRDRVRPICLMVPEVTKNNSSRISGAGKNSSQDIDNKADKKGVKRENKDSAVHEVAAPAIGFEASSLPDSKAAAHNSAVTPVTDGAESGDVERVRITQKFKLEFAVDPEFMEKFSRVRSLLSNKYPKGMNFEIIFNILMTEYLNRHSPEERIKNEAPARSAARERRSQRRTSGSREIVGARNNIPKNGVGIYRTI
jgi:hypothetical protein